VLLLFFVIEFLHTVVAGHALFKTAIKKEENYENGTQKNNVCH